MLPSRELHQIRSRIPNEGEAFAEDAHRLVEIAEDCMQIVRTLVDAAPLLCASCAFDRKCVTCPLFLAKKFLYHDKATSMPSVGITQAPNRQLHVF